MSWSMFFSEADSITGQDLSSCFSVSKSETTLYFSDIYSAEFVDWGLVREAAFLGQSFEMYRFTVRGVQKSKTQPSVLVPSSYTFGHKDSQTCQMWVNRINDLLKMDAERPKNLLVLVNPKSGKGLGCKVWETVAPTFSQAKVKTKVTVTERAGQALDIMSSITSRELRSYDGVVAVGGDGFFNEILNGLLLSRHKCSYPPSPTELNHPVENNGSGLVLETNVDIRDPSDSGEDESPLLKQSTNLMYPELQEPEKIPAKQQRKILSFLSQMKNSDLDSFRQDQQMPLSYEAEVAYVEVESEKKNTGLDKASGGWTKGLWSLLKKSERVACRANFNICKTKAGHTSAKCPSLQPYSKDSRWLKSKGNFLSVGAAVISCRNEKAPDGLVADAHLSDGFLHLILIKDCPHACYLCHLLQLAKKDGNPLDFEFVEHHKTPAFTFTSFGKESIWNVDGELFQAHQLSAQVFCGLINLFASGPEA
ncbi:Ceramide kinase [Capsicum baccatum]|uniref:Ceramide kinase n=1 Tax=Capsicum baccatum TaxID=33114 RepID=A0A2G2VJY2_CAPBA|nr:Ceramide kinase [Capsicum baccatum]